MKELVEIVLVTLLTSFALDRAKAALSRRRAWRSYRSMVAAA